MLVDVDFGHTEPGLTLTVGMGSRLHTERQQFMLHRRCYRRETLMAIRFEEVADELRIHYDQQLCARCILPASFPDISFDEAGVCSYCNDEQEQVLVDPQTISQAVESALAGADPQRNYDCLALFSGGKDSSLALSVARRTLGLRVLAFTLDNGFLSRGSSANMRRVLDELEIDHVRFRPPGGMMRPLYKISMGLEFASDTTKYSTGGCGSCISMVLASGLRFASAHRIPLLIGGWTPGQFTTSPLVPASFLNNVVERHFEPLTAASSTLREQLTGWLATPTGATPVGLLNPLYATRYSEEATLAELAKIGWVKPKDTDSCSTNCQVNGLLVLDHIKRYQFHPYVYELSHHVRLGALSRVEALDKITRVGIQPSGVTRIAAELGVASSLDLAPAGIGDVSGRR
ncbi:adenine nucleotide alpha hydrolase family protein [Streptomyces sasae]|uniref:hypothetical protein n=1 Tax=Streptomyces sasae TaxID=1266772 RepID=UPI00292DFC1F|nr:hypothetical protein [Streptomyces sasae]